MISPYWYEDFSVEDLKDVLISADDEKLNEFRVALLDELNRREEAKAKSIELLHTLQNVIENIESEGFKVTYRDCTTILNNFDVIPDF